MPRERKTTAKSMPGIINVEEVINPMKAIFISWNNVGDEENEVVDPSCNKKLNAHKNASTQKKVIQLDTFLYLSFKSIDIVIIEANIIEVITRAVTRGNLSKIIVTEKADKIAPIPYPIIKDKRNKIFFLKFLNKVAMFSTSAKYMPIIIAVVEALTPGTPILNNPISIPFKHTNK